MPAEIPVTLPDYLEAVFVAPDGSRIGVYRNGDYVQGDWKILQIRMRREVTHPTLRVPWGELIFATTGCALVVQHFGLRGLLATGVVVWIAQRLFENVRREIELRQRATAQEQRSSAPSEGL